jgi:outer membrane lipoprotein carrier protein
MRLKAIAVTVCLLASLTATAGEGLERLRSFSAGLKSMQADFTQTVFDDQMRQLEVSRGQVAIQKPGKFRWDYKAPYVQHIIADGEKVWLYDPELEQVTVKPLSDALGSAPIALLSGDGDLDKQFKFTELGNIEGREFVQLEVKVKDTDYGLMLLALGKDGMDVMELKDKLGQVTRIEFSNVKMNKRIDGKLFKFDIPKGVDVLGQ